jgi:hypothetical protein
VHGALACGEGSDSIRQELNSRRAAYEADLRRRLVRAKAEGDLPPDANPADLARYFVTVVRGMAVEAAGGASSHQLRRVVRLALRAWPE